MKISIKKCLIVTMLVIYPAALCSMQQKRILRDTFNSKSIEQLQQWCIENPNHVSFDVGQDVLRKKNIWKRRHRPEEVLKTRLPVRVLDSDNETPHFPNLSDSVPAFVVIEESARQVKRETLEHQRVTNIEMTEIPHTDRASLVPQSMTPNTLTCLWNEETAAADRALVGNVEILHKNGGAEVGSQGLTRSQVASMLAASERSKGEEFFKNMDIEELRSWVIAHQKHRDLRLASEILEKKNEYGSLPLDPSYKKKYFEGQPKKEENKLGVTNPPSPIGNQLKPAERIPQVVVPKDPKEVLDKLSKALEARDSQSMSSFIWLHKGKFALGVALSAGVTADLTCAYYKIRDNDEWKQANMRQRCILLPCKTKTAELICKIIKRIS